MKNNIFPWFNNILGDNGYWEWAIYFGIEHEEYGWVSSEPWRINRDLVLYRKATKEESKVLDCFEFDQKGHNFKINISREMKIALVGSRKSEWSEIIKKLKKKGDYKHLVREVRALESKLGKIVWRI